MSGASLWLPAEPLILASGSLTRREMLVAAGIPVEVVRPDIDERALEHDLAGEGVSSTEMAQRLAAAKAQAVSTLHPERLVLAADQTLICGSEAFHKPADREAAAAQLMALAGRTHQLHSAFALACNGVVIDKGCETASLTMRPLSRDIIARYLDVAGPVVLTSVGAYQLEGLGAQLFERIDGDHFTILGLPLLPVLAALRGQGCLAS